MSLAQFFSVLITSDGNELYLHTAAMFGVLKAAVTGCLFAFDFQPFSALLLIEQSLVKVLISVLGCKECRRSFNKTRAFKDSFEF